MIHHILFTCFSVCKVLEDSLNNIVDGISEKIGEFIGLCLCLCLCLPFFLFKNIFEMSFNLCKMERRYKKNVWAFMKWYRENVKEEE